MSFLKIRADHADIEKWKALAVTAGMDFSKWVRQTLKNPSSTVARAIENGILVRPEHCSECGKSCRPQAHHDDYNELLAVRWLCEQCHVDWHNSNEPIRSGDMQRRITVVCTDAEYAEIKGKAGLVPLSVWIKSQVLNGTGYDQGVRGTGGDGVDPRGTAVLARPANDFIGAIVTRTSSPTIPDSTPAGGTVQHTLDAVAPEAQKRGKVSFTVPAPSKNKSKNWCRHGIMKGGRCVRCSGGIAR